MNPPRKRFVPPLGKLGRWRFVTVNPAERQPRFIMPNRYPGQIIGIGVRLPDGGRINDRIPHYSLSIMWATAADWWAK